MVILPPGSVCNHAQGSHKEREEEECDEGGLQLCNLACLLWRLTAVSQADLGTNTYFSIHVWVYHISPCHSIMKEFCLFWMVAHQKADSILMNHSMIQVQLPIILNSFMVQHNATKRLSPFPESNSWTQSKASQFGKVTWCWRVKQHGIVYHSSLAFETP